MASESAREGARVEVQWRWLWLPASLVVLILLRHHTLWLTLYVVGVLTALVVRYLLLPKRAFDAERTFHREALRHLAADDPDGLEKLAADAWLLRRFGRPHVIPDTLGLAAAARGDHERARALYVEALRAAPASERSRIELNLAGEELATGAYDAAEGRLRTALARRPDLTPARINLARVLLAKGESLPEAAELLAEAARDCDRRELGEVHLARAEALARAGRSEWRAAVADARAAGADEVDEAAFARWAGEPT